jgi:DNA repair exonuclease SbcCD ATPase subunit
MKILKLQAENVKKLTVVEINPQGNLIQITGKNGHGKTSVLDAIWWALAGRDHIQGEPIRRGADKATVFLELGTSGKIELTVERRFTKENSYLTVRTADGAKYPKPQRLLDDMLGALSFDPLAFMRSARKEQYDLLRSLVKLPIDPTEIARLNQADYDARTRINREVDRLNVQAGMIMVPGGLPDTPVDEMAVVHEITAAGEKNTSIALLRQRQIDDAKRIATARSEAAELRQRAAVLEEEANVLERNPLLMLPLPVDVNALSEKLRQAQATNTAIRRARERKAIEVDASKLERQSDELTSKMKARSMALDKALAETILPVPGLGFGDNVVTLDGLPLDQASDAQQLLTSTAIAAAFNPTLRVLRIRDGSLLDREHMAWLAEFAEKSDLQIWIESVESDAPAAIWMEDGHVKQQAAE